jgi:MFS family permease
MLSAKRLLADIGPLRESAAFRRLWAGTTVSSVGSALTYFAVMLQVYDLTRSTFAVGLLGVAQAVPTLAVGLLGGPLTDALDRRTLVLVTSGCLAAVSAALAAQAFAGLNQVWLLYLLVAVQFGLSALDRPARGTFTPALLPASQVTAALALDRISFQITLTAGPALAGLIAAAPHLGLRACYLVDAVSYSAALYGVGRLPRLRRPAGRPRLGPRAVAEGFRFIRHSQVLAGAFLADLSATIFALPLALFPAINAERFGGDPRTLGLFTTAIGLGGLGSAVLSGPMGRISRPGRAMLVTVAIWGAAFAGFAVAPAVLWLTVGLLAVAGAADTFTVVFRVSLVQAVTTEALRGRLLAADYVVGAGGGQLGSLCSGALGSLTTPVISAFTGGLLTIVAVAGIGLTLPAFRQYRRQPAVPAAAEPGADPVSESTLRK